MAEELLTEVLASHRQGLRQEKCIKKQRQRGSICDNRETGSMSSCKRTMLDQNTSKLTISRWSL